VRCPGCATYYTQYRKQLQIAKNRDRFIYYVRVMFSCYLLEDIDPPGSLIISRIYYLGFLSSKTRQMAGNIKPMSQIKQLLLLIQLVKKIKFIARTLGMSKNTVKSYLSKTTELKLPLEHLLSLEDPVLE